MKKPLASVDPVYNPLHKKHLGESITRALLEQPVSALDLPDRFKGAGIYAIYYIGDFAAYARLAELNREGRFQRPIYVGKAVPKGARKGGLGLDVDAGYVLFDRLGEHAKSIEQSENLNLVDFHCRYLTVDDIWIPLGESLLIEMFQPLWNRVIDGFGNHDPGGGRRKQRCSQWDVMHPGRPWAKTLAPCKQDMTELLQHVENYMVNNLPDVRPDHA